MQAKEVLRSVSLFSGLSPRFIDGLAKNCTTRKFEAGAVIVRQGNPGVGLFIISDGQVKVVKTTDTGESYEVGHHGPGDVIGEMSVLDGAPRSANVIAETDCECLVLTSWDFTAFMKSHPEVALEILPVVVQRFRETNEALMSSRETGK